jgi:hypothetical protein
MAPSLSFFFSKMGVEETSAGRVELKNGTNKALPSTGLPDRLWVLSLPLCAELSFRECHSAGL